MPELRLPEEQRFAFAKLMNLSQEAVGEVISALREVRPRVFAEDISKELVSKVKGTPSEDIVEIVEAVVSLLVSGFHHDLSPDEMVSDVIGAILKPENKESPVSLPYGEETLRQRLASLIKNEVLIIAAKAQGIMQNNKNTYMAARVITDVRPVFGTDVTKAPCAAVVIHTLNISYLQDREVKEFYIALDASEIVDLGKVLDRAKLKGASLKSMIDRSGVIYLDTQD